MVGSVASMHKHPPKPPERLPPVAKPLSDPHQRSVGEQQVLKEWKEDVKSVCTE